MFQPNNLTRRSLLTLPAYTLPCGNLAWAKKTKRYITIDSHNPRWLRWSDGTPFFMCGPGDPESFLFRGERQKNGIYKGDQIEMMEKVARAGANCLWWVGMRSHGGDGGPLENMFIDGDPNKGLNHAVLDQWEEWLGIAEKLGLVVSFFFYDDEVQVEVGPQSPGWLLQVNNQLHPQEAEMVAEIVKRFSKYGNLIWGAMEVADKRGKRFVPHLKAMSKFIRDNDPYLHPIAMSVGYAGDSFADYANDPNIDMYNIMKLERLSADEINQRGLGYFAAAEDRYVCNFAETHGYGKGDIARQKNWATAMSGCYVQVHGHHIFNNSEQDLIDCALVSSFFESVDFYGMVPNNRIAKNETKYVMEDSGKRYIVYSRNASEDGVMGLWQIPDGEYSVVWLDCINGKKKKYNKTLKANNKKITQLKKPKDFGPEVAAYLALRNNA